MKLFPSTFLTREQRDKTTFVQSGVLSPENQGLILKQQFTTLLLLLDSNKGGSNIHLSLKWVQFIVWLTQISLLFDVIIIVNAPLDLPAFLWTTVESSNEMWDLVELSQLLESFFCQYEMFDANPECFT